MATRLLSVTTVAERLDCSRGHVYGLIAAKKLKPADIAATGTKSKTRIREADLEAYIDASTRDIA